MNFQPFQQAITDQFALMQDNYLYHVELDKTILWETYLNSYPKESNPVFRERTVHDCQCCKQFICKMAHVVCFIDGRQYTIWDKAATDPDLNVAYRTVAQQMTQLVRSAPIRGPFYHYENQVGTRSNNGLNPAGAAETWEHFHVHLPTTAFKRKDRIPFSIGESTTSKEVFHRALIDISMEAVDTVLDLIAQNSLYRGEENKAIVDAFKTYLTDWNNRELGQHDQFLWDAALRAPRPLTHIRNTSIGTLLVDLSEGKSLDAAVGAFEAMVAPANYKRTTALVTPGMIKKAKEKVEELGLGTALQRRHAKTEDISINNVLYADRNTTNTMEGNDPFESLASHTSSSINLQSLAKVEEISIKDFIANILPKTEQLELLVENGHNGNLMSLIAPADPEAKAMLQWGNNFSWSYQGDVTDSMKERVKAAGGAVDGIIRFSIQWNDGEYNRCDYDAHVREPGGHIYYGQTKLHETGGNLDVDIRWPEEGVVAVENITWPYRDRMKAGVYKFNVHNFAARGGNNGFTAEIEHNGIIRSYSYPRSIPNDRTVEVATIRFDPDTNDFTVIQEMDSTVASKEMWGIQSQQFQRVSLVMNSPNHWDGEETGNKHYFFILEGCYREGSIRGLYNEFLVGSLREHRKVFEVLGSKLMVEESDNQLSGLGFSSTQRNHVYCKVTGSFTRTLKITF